MLRLISTTSNANADHPTMGAYEFSSEVLIPKSVAGYPEVVNITDNSADVKIKADEMVRLIFL